MTRNSAAIGGRDDERKAMKSGSLYSRGDLLPWKTLFEHLHAALREEFLPSGSMEEELVCQLAYLRFLRIIVVIRDHFRREAYESSVITESKLIFDLKLAA
jgi:hypothetical protein